MQDLTYSNIHPLFNIDDLLSIILQYRMAPTGVNLYDTMTARFVNKGTYLHLLLTDQSKEYVDRWCSHFPDFSHAETDTEQHVLGGFIDNLFSNHYNTIQVISKCLTTCTNHVIANIIIDHHVGPQLDHQCLLAYLLCSHNYHLFERPEYINNFFYQRFLLILCAIQRSRPDKFYRELLPFMNVVDQRTLLSSVLVNSEDLSSLFTTTSTPKSFTLIYDWVCSLEKEFKNWRHVPWRRRVWSKIIETSRITELNILATSLDRKEVITQISPDTITIGRINTPNGRKRAFDSVMSACLTDTFQVLPPTRTITWLSSDRDPTHFRQRTLRRRPDRVRRLIRHWRL